MKKNNRYKYISLASIILMPFGATAVSAVENTASAEDTIEVSADETNSKSEDLVVTGNDEKTPSLDEVLKNKQENSSQDKNKLHSLNSLVNARPVAETDKTFNWNGVTITLDATGTLSIPSGTITNPKELARFLGSYATNSSLVKKIIIEGPVTLIGDASSMFAGFGNISTIEGLKNLNTTQVTSMAEMFSGTPVTSLDLSSFNTSNVTNMRGMFTGSGVTTLNLSNFNTAKVTDMSQMFSNIVGLTSIDLSKFDTSQVTDMSQMFFNDSNLGSLDLSSFNTAQVTNMSGMFNMATNLTSLNVSSFNTAKVTNMASMFTGLEKVTTLDVSGFDTTNVTDMSWMFQGNKVLSTLDVSKFNTAKVTTLYGMFSTDAGLTNLDVSKWDTSLVTDMSYLFYGTSSLKNIDVSKWNTSQVTYMSNMFRNMTALEKLDLSSFDDSRLASRDNMLASDKKIKELKLGNKFNLTTAAGLPSVSATKQYTGKWQSVGTGTIDKPNGEKVWTSAQLIANNFKTEGADTYVWQKNVGSDVTVQYVDEEGNKIAADSTLSGLYGEIFAVDPITISGYTFKEASNGVSSGSFTNTPQTITMIYTKDIVVGGDVTIKFIDAKGKQIAEDNILKGNIGESFTYPEAPTIEGYTFKEIVETPIAAKAALFEKLETSVSPTKVGTFTADPQVINYVYTKNLVTPVDPPKPIKKTIAKTVAKELPRTDINQKFSTILSVVGITLISIIGLTTLKKGNN